MASSSTTAANDPPPRSPPRPAKDSVALVHIYVGGYTPDPPDDPVITAVRKSLDTIQAHIRASVATALGPEFSVAEIAVVEDASFEVVAVIALIAGVISTYGAVRTGLDYVRADAQAIVARRLPANPVAKIESYVEPGPAMARFPVVPDTSSSRSTSSWSPSSPYWIGLVTLVILVLLGLLLTVVLEKVL